MTPLALPPEAVAEVKATCGAPVTQALSVVVPPFVIVTINGPATAHERPVNVTLYVPGESCIE